MTSHFLAILALTACLVACGQKGDLYLPKAPPPPTLPGTPS